MSFWQFTDVIMLLGICYQKYIRTVGHDTNPCQGHHQQRIPHSSSQYTVGDSQQQLKVSDSSIAVRTVCIACEMNLRTYWCQCAHTQMGKSYELLITFIGKLSFDAAANIQGLLGFQWTSLQMHFLLSSCWYLIFQEFSLRSQISASWKTYRLKFKHTHRNYSWDK